MSDQKRPISGDEAFDKAKEYAQNNPEGARSAIDKVEDAISQRTGGRFDSVIEAGGEFVEKQLGLPENSSAPEETPAPNPAPAPEDPQPQDPNGPATPGEGPGGAPQETPGQPAPEPQTTPSPAPAPDPTTAPDADPQTRPAEPAPQSEGEGRLPG